VVFGDIKCRCMMSKSKKGENANMSQDEEHLKGNADELMRWIEEFKIKE